MASTFSDLGIELMATGENAGTWGDKTNSNLNLVQQAVAGYQEINVASADVTLAMTDATISNARNMTLKFTGTLAANRTVSIPDSIEKTFLETFGNIEPEELKKRIEKENFLDEKNEGFWEFYVKIVDEIRPLVEKEAKEITGFLGQGALQDLFNRIDEVKHFFFRTLNVATDLREDGKLQKADDEIVETGLRVGVYLFIQNNFFKLIAEQIKSFFHDATLE